MLKVFCNVIFQCDVVMMNIIAFAESLIIQNIFLDRLMINDPVVKVSQVYSIMINIYNN